MVITKAVLQPVCNQRIVIDMKVKKPLMFTDAMR